MAKHKDLNQSSLLSKEASILSNILKIAFARIRSLRPGHLVAIGVLAAFVVSGTSFSKFPPVRNLVSADANRVVSLSYCGNQKIVTTDAKTVQEVLNRAEIKLNQGDLVEPTLNSPISDTFFNINVYCSQAYRITDGTRETTVLSAQQSPRLIASDAGITVYPEDKIIFEQANDFIADKVVGQRIIIQRATLVLLAVDGKEVALRTRQATVDGLIQEKGLKLGEKDTVVPALSSKLSQGMRVRITRVATVVHDEEEVISRPVQRIYDTNLLRGTTNVRSEGADGKKTVTYEITYHNGSVVKKRALNSKTTLEPKSRVEVVGTKVFYANEVVALAASKAAERGWVNEQWDALYKLWTKESNFNPAAQNRSSGACGIPQAYPCSKLPGFPNDPEAQINWGLNYIANRYGTPANAWNYWLSHNSY